MEWYYEKNGKQHGPISEDELGELLLKNELDPDNLVWKEGMEDWKPLGEVFGDNNDSPQNLSESDKEPIRYETGENSSNSEIRSIARQRLTGLWGRSAVTTLIWSLLPSFVNIVPVLGAIINFSISGSFFLGYNKYSIKIARNQSPEITELFSGFQQFWKAFGLYVLISLITVFAMFVAAIPGGIIVGILANAIEVEETREIALFFAILLMIIPVLFVGAYVYLRYSLAYFILHDNPSIGVTESMNKSVNLLKGNMKKLFNLYLGFTGWILLSILTLFIGLLWVVPYMTVSVAIFYDELCCDDRSV